LQQDHTLLSLSPPSLLPSLSPRSSLALYLPQIRSHILR
jgi:hypothetical protein